MTLTRLLVLSLLLIFSSCSKEDKYIINGKNGIKLKSIIKFKSIKHQELPADSFSSTLIEVQLSNETDSENRSIILSTNKGNFSNGTQETTLHANSAGIAYAILTSGKEPGNVLLKAKVKDIETDTIINFVPALPDDFLFKSHVTIIDTTDTLDFTVELFRDSGHVTDNLKVEFTYEAIDNPDDLLDLPNFAYSENEKAKVTLTNPYGVVGKFEIKATVRLSSGADLQKSILLIIE